MFQLVQTAQQGWQCPVCQRVYSPATVMCMSCPQPTITTTDTVTVTVCDHDWNEEMTAPSCRRCGTMKPTDFSWTPQILYPLGGSNT